ncbi:MAG: mannose-1-phosphate guanylyltransferase, partial [Bacillota bacterium]|nr:mannose-1-phosphate guanylyltransferase [Bacillota bacterium]
TGKACINGEYKVVNAGDVIQIPINTRHNIKAYEKMEIIEIQLGDIIKVTDKSKYEM